MTHFCYFEKKQNFRMVPAQVDPSRYLLLDIGNSIEVREYISL